MVYLCPEVLPGLRCKDVHVLLDFEEYQQNNHIRIIVTREFITPTGSWIFPLSSVSLTKKPVPSITQPPEEPEDELESDAPRHRSITQRRLKQYGITPDCNGCLNGSYLHSAACRARFDDLLNAAEPRISGPGGDC